MIISICCSAVVAIIGQLISPARFNSPQLWFHLLNRFLCHLQYFCALTFRLRLTVRVKRYTHTLHFSETEVSYPHFRRVSQTEASAKPNMCHCIAILQLKVFSGACGAFSRCGIRRAFVFFTVKKLNKQKVYTTNVSCTHLMSCGL